jgi:hypothetical protein
MNVFDAGAQRLVLLLTRGRVALALEPAKVAAARDVQNQTEERDGMFLFHRVDPLEALRGGSEMMPRVFFTGMIYDMVAVRNVACVWTLGAMSYLVGPGSGEWKVTRARIMKLNLSAKNSGRSSFGAGRRYSWADTSPFLYAGHDPEHMGLKSPAGRCERNCKPRATAE